MMDEVAADLSDDIDSVDILSEDWKGTYPWDDGNRGMYMEAENPTGGGSGRSRHWPRKTSTRSRRLLEASAQEVLS